MERRGSSTRGSNYCNTEAFGKAGRGFILLGEVFEKRGKRKKYVIEVVFWGDDVRQKFIFKYIFFLYLFLCVWSVEEFFVLVSRRFLEKGGGQSLCIMDETAVN